jgi:hypothetical protein
VISTRRASRVRWWYQCDRRGGRAAVEWWGSWRGQGQELTFAGVTVLRFNDEGKVVDHRDYDNHVERREAAGST